MTGSCKHDALPKGINDLGSVAYAIVMLDMPKVMANIDGFGIDRRGIMSNRVGLVVAAQDRDVTVECRRKEKCLSLGCSGVEDPTDGRHEPHVGHAVCLVDNHDVNVAET